MRDLKYVFGHLGWNDRALRWHRGLVERHQARGYQVQPFCLVPRPPAQRLSFQELDRRWRRRSRDVVRLYQRLRKALEGADVFIVFNGANVHPEWLSDFKTFNVFICWDDPESSHDLSEPVARYFDYALTGNAACVPLYQSWGVRRCEFIPLGLHEGEYDPNLTAEMIRRGERHRDIVFFGECESPWRRERLARLRQAFPQALMHGRGWSSGFVGDEEKLKLYASARVGWNLHNSVGPVNLRVFSLPANGLLQICDNKCRLGSLFRLGAEIVGFDTVDECIDLTHYYLTHEEERREIAARGFERVKADYTEDKVWQRMLSIIAPHVEAKRQGHLDAMEYQCAPITLGKRLTDAALGTLRRAGFELRRVPTKERAGESQDICRSAYRENAEAGPINLAEKVKRAASSGFFEWPNMVALNWTVASLVGTATSIAEIGGGTGCFAHEAAADARRRVICADLDAEAIDWARQNRSRPNIHYLSRILKPDDGPFDLVVAVDVIEHVADYPAFLRACTALAPRALITTPNRSRSPDANHNGPPQYWQHVREWTAGEFYWVLRAFYKEVRLLAMKDPHIPESVPVDVDSKLTPLIADCRNPVLTGESPCV